MLYIFRLYCSRSYQNTKSFFFRNRWFFLEKDILLLGSYTRFSCSQIKWNTQRAKKKTPLFNPLYPISSSRTGWTNWPINELDENMLARLNYDNFSSRIFYIIYAHTPCLSTLISRSFSGSSLYNATFVPM